MKINIRESTDADCPWIRDLMDATWGLPVVSISGAYDPSNLPGLVAEADRFPPWLTDLSARAGV